MIDDMFRVVLETAGAKTDKDGWETFADGRLLTLHCAHNGVSFTVSKVEAVKLAQRIVWARTTKGDTVIVGLDDLFAAVVDRPSEGGPSGGRKAGFLG